MKYKVLLPVLSLFLSLSASAQDFDLDTAITSDGQVLNSGLPVYALDFSGVAATINGVDFSDLNDESNFTASGFHETATDGSTAPMMSAAFGDVLSVSGTSGRGFGEILVGGLTPGQTYQLQLFAGGTGEDGSETLTDGSSTGDLAYGAAGSEVYSITETFTAMTTYEEVDFAPDNGGLVALNAIDLREEVAAAPEPSVWTLILASLPLMLLVLAARRGAVLS